MKNTFLIHTSHKKNGDCKYKPICDLYTNNSYTCTHSGGGYCGKYRKLEQKARDDPQTGMYLIETSVA